MKKSIIYVVALVLAVTMSGCSTQTARAPKIAVGDGPVIYLTHVDRIPREAIGSGVVRPGVDVPTGVGGGGAIEVVGGIVTEITPELAKAYTEVERNTAARSVEIYITGYTNITGQEIGDIVDTFNDIVGQPFPTK